MGDTTIRDVARHAGVSVASVSRALNGHSNVHADTRARVVASADALGYVPHAGARSLSMARTGAIGVVLPDFHGEFFSELMRGMDTEAYARGYQLLLSNMHGGPELAGNVLRAMRGRVDGLIVMAPQVPAEDVASILPRTIPAVLVASRAADDTHHAFYVDNARAARTMVTHLVSSGRRAIVHIAGPAGNLDAAERRDAFLAAAEQAGCAAIVVEGDFREGSGAQAIRALIAAGTEFDAVFAANDGMALGVLMALREAGIAVPDQVAVAGFDDVPLARLLSLTTMRVHVAELGADAIRRLVGLIDRADDPPARHLIVPELVVRDTAPGIVAARERRTA